MVPLVTRVDLGGSYVHAENVIRGCRTIALAATLLLSAGAAAEQEVPGAKDFPLIKRYEGSRLIGYDSRSVRYGQLSSASSTLGDNGQPAPDSVRQLEGRHTRLLYLAPQTRSSLEVFRNYETSFSERLHYPLQLLRRGAVRFVGAELYRVLYPPTNALQNNELSKVALNVPAEPHYLAATWPAPRSGPRSRCTLPSTAAPPFRKPRTAWPSCSTSSRTSPWKRRW